MNKKVRDTIKKIYTTIERTPLSHVMSGAYLIVDYIEYHWYDRKWKKQGYALPCQDEIEAVRNQVTFIFKSFERQKFAIRLIKSIQHYYPGAQIVVADDSSKPLSELVESRITDLKNIKILQLPFNSGLSYGIQCALNEVNTPYVIRMDDDQILTRRTQFGKQLRFLMDYPSVDLTGVLQFTTPVPREPEIASREFFKAKLGYPAHPPILPNLTQIDADHIVVLKASNVFLARTEKLKKIGYDSNIRMIDHNDFFCRACGTLVSVIDTSALVHHSHNRFDHHYKKYRSDIEGDYAYISKKIDAQYNITGQKSDLL